MRVPNYPAVRQSPKGVIRADFDFLSRDSINGVLSLWGVMEGIGGRQPGLDPL